MNENGLSWRCRGVRAAGPALVAAFGLALLAGGPARAAAAKRYTLGPQQLRNFQVWSNYLAQGPQTWNSTRAPAFTPAVRTTIWQVLKNDSVEQQIANPMIDYLLWRRSLNPTRFSVNHPYLSPTLAQLLNSLQTPPTPTTPVVTTPIVTTPIVTTPPSVISPSPLIPPSKQTTSPQGVTPPAVPEPGSLLLAAGMVGWGLWWRRRMVPAPGR